MLDTVTINQLRTFIAVCEETSFTGAARRLRRAQSAVSHAISALETALGVELFERDARRAELTAAGRSLLPDARAVVARTEELKNRAKLISAEGVPLYTDARLYCEAGVPTVIYGAGPRTLLDANGHRADEKVVIEDLTLRKVLRFKPQLGRDQVESS